MPSNKVKRVKGWAVVNSQTGFIYGIQKHIYPTKREAKESAPFSNSSIAIIVKAVITYKLPSPKIKGKKKLK